jgi:GTP-binding protein HflX
MVRTTQQVLGEIGVKDIPTITAYNKADKTDRNYPQIEGDDIIYSAIDERSIKLLANLIVKRVFSNYDKFNLKLPLADGKLLAYLHEHAQVQDEDYRDDGVYVTANIAPADQNRFKEFLV